MSDTHPGNLDALIDKADRLAVIGSPSSTTELVLDVLGTAVTRKLVGELALFRFNQDSVSHYALGQITEIQLRNAWHEDPTMRSLIRQRGRVDSVSERQDTHLGKMTVSAVFRAAGPKRYEPSILGTVPCTGTSAHVISDEMLGIILEPYKDQLFYLGHLYGSTPKLPMWFKHFDSGVDGAGEAYHLGIFGKTGAGKSELARMILLAYARYPAMGILVIDPQGEFSQGMSQGGTAGHFGLPMGDIIKSHNKQVVVLRVRDLVLDRWDLFKEVLTESRFFRELQIMTVDKAALAADVLVEAWRKKTTFKNVHTREAFDDAWRLLQSAPIRNKIYAKDGAAAERFSDAINEAKPDDLFRDIWEPLAKLFWENRPGGKTVDSALSWLLRGSAGRRGVLVVDLSKPKDSTLLWNDRIQQLVIKRLLDGVVFNAEESYGEKKSLNTLVLLDEAHRFAPREIAPENDLGRSLRRTLTDAVRTTRKYGLGWFFVSQTLSSIDSEIIQQLRIMFFGFGLALGQEYQSLRQLVGSSSAALDLYQLFRDPHSSFDPTNRQYSWMTIGPVSPLSFAGTPLFFNAFNRVEEFLAGNKLKSNGSLFKAAP